MSLAYEVTGEGDSDLVLLACAPNTRTVRDLLAGSGLRFDDRGTVELKGIPGDWTLYAASLPPA